MNFNFLIIFCQRHFYLCSHLHVACKIIINYQNDSLLLISSRSGFLPLNFRNFLRAKLSASFLDLSNRDEKSEFFTHRINLNWRYYLFHDSKFKEEKLRFLWGMTEYIPPNRRLDSILPICYCFTKTKSETDKD